MQRRAVLGVDTMAVRKRFINPFARRESPNQSAASHVGIEASPNSELPLDETQETGPNSTDEEIIDEKTQSGTQKAQPSSQSWPRIP